MSLNIKNKEVIGLVEKAARLGGTNKTEAIKLALTDLVQKLDVDGRAERYLLIKEIVSNGKMSASDIQASERIEREMFDYLEDE